MKKLIRAGEITPVDVEVEVPDPVPPRPVLFVPTEYRTLRQDDWFYPVQDWIPRPVYHCDEPDNPDALRWILRPIIDPPLVTAEQFEAIGTILNMYDTDTACWRMVREAFRLTSNDQFVVGVLGKLRDRARECGLTNGAV